MPDDPQPLLYVERLDPMVRRWELMPGAVYAPSERLSAVDFARSTHDSLGWTCRVVRIVGDRIAKILKVF